MGEASGRLPQAASKGLVHGGLVLHSNKTHSPANSKHLSAGEMPKPGRANTARGGAENAVASAPDDDDGCFDLGVALAL